MSRSQTSLDSDVSGTSSASHFKRDVLSATFMPHRLLTGEELDKWALDFLTFGNAYIKQRKASHGDALALKSALAQYFRRRIDLQRFAQLNGLQQLEHEFEPGSVHHLTEPDIT